MRTHTHRSALRRSREVTQVCSRKVTHPNELLAQGKCAAWMPRRARRPARGWGTKTLRAFGADDTAFSSLARGQGLFFAWVSLSEHKWVTSRERRGRLRGERQTGAVSGPHSPVRWLP